MSKNELESKTLKELHSICKELKVKHYEGKNSMTKQKLVESILEATNSSEDGSENAKVEEKIETDKEAVVKEKETAIVNSVLEKQVHIETAQVGQIFAFREESGKLNTAALVNRSSKKRIVKLITQYDKEFLIPYENVVWVKVPRGRWPKFVYEELKGDKNGKVDKQA